MSKKRIQRTHEQWVKLIDAYEHSSLSLTEFCRANQLSQSYFMVKRRQISKSAHSPESGFAKAFLASDSDSYYEGLAINHHGTRLQLPMVVDPVWLAQLMKALAT